MAITSGASKKRSGKGLGLQAKFALTYIALIGAVLLFLNTYPVLASQNLVFQSKQDSLQSQAVLLVSNLEGLGDLTSSGVGQVMEQLSLRSLTQVIITDADGVVVYDTDRSAGSVGAKCDWPELYQAIGGRSDVFRSTFSQSAFQSRAAAPVTVDGEVIGGVCLFEYDTTQAGLILSIQRNLRSISIGIAAVTLALSLVLSKAVTQRISRLLQAMQAVGGGDYGHRVSISGRDELHQLGEEFNDLTQRLQTTEEIRRRFVADASHELKTPLASIRLLTDSITQSEGMDEGTLREFVGDIDQEAARLTRITEKLLTLTRVDAQTAARGEEPPTEVAPVIRRAAHMLSPLAAQQQVTLKCDLDGEATAPCGEDDLYQIAFNLMENAIKYNLPGGEVAVSLRREEGGTVLQVSDTGVGIPEDDLEKVFRRFYRVDKARSRAAGGTGLGLAIVRGTVELCGGSVSARRRRDGQGTVFTVAFPYGSGR